MAEYTLCATREGCDTKDLGRREWASLELAMAWAQGRVEGVEGDSAHWPQGYDAVLVEPDGSFWVLVDEWERGFGTMMG